MREMLGVALFGTTLMGLLFMLVCPELILGLMNFFESVIDDKK